MSQESLHIQRGESFDHLLTIKLDSGADMTGWANGATVTATVRISSEAEESLLELEVTDVVSTEAEVSMNLFAGVSQTLHLPVANAVFRVRFFWPDLDRSHPTPWIPINIIN